MPRLLPTLATALLAAATFTSLDAREVETALLRGTVTIGGYTVVPPGSLLRVELHDLTRGVPKQATVAKQTFEAEGKTPIAFELKYITGAVEPNRLYGVAATITNSRGQALWETRVPIRVLTLGNQKKVQLLLRPVEQPKAPPDPTSFTVDCGELRFDVRLDDRSATVMLDGAKRVLPRTESNSSKRYSDGTTILAVSGKAVYFQTPERAYRDCKVLTDPAAPAAP